MRQLKRATMITLSYRCRCFYREQCSSCRARAAESPQLLTESPLTWAAVGSRESGASRSSTETAAPPASLGGDHRKILLNFGGARPKTLIITVQHVQRAVAVSDDKAPRRARQALVVKLEVLRPAQPPCCCRVVAVGLERRRIGGVGGIQAVVGQNGCGLLVM